MDAGDGLERTDGRKVRAVDAVSRGVGTSLRADHFRRIEGLPQSGRHHQPVPRGGQLQPVQQVRGPAGPSPVGPGGDVGGHRGPAGTGSRMDAALSRHLVVHPAHHDRHGALHWVEIRIGGAVLHHHRSGGRLLSRGIQPGQDHRQRRILPRGPRRSGRGENGGQLRGQPAGGKGSDQGRLYPGALAGRRRAEIHRGSGCDEHSVQDWRKGGIPTPRRHHPGRHHTRFGAEAVEKLGRAGGGISAHHRRGDRSPGQWHPGRGIRRRHRGGDFAGGSPALPGSNL